MRIWRSRRKNEALFLLWIFEQLPWNKTVIWWGRIFGAGGRALPYKFLFPHSPATVCVCCEGARSPRTRAPRPSHSTGPAASGAVCRCPLRHIPGSAYSVDIWGRSHKRCWAHDWRWPGFPRTPPYTRGKSFCNAHFSVDIPDRSCGYKAAAQGRWRFPDTRGTWGPPLKGYVPLASLHPYSRPWLQMSSSVYFRFWQTPKVKWYDTRSLSSTKYDLQQLYRRLGRHDRWVSGPDLETPESIKTITAKFKPWPRMPLPRFSDRKGNWSVSETSPSGGPGRNDCDSL